MRIIPKINTCGFGHDNPDVFAMSQWQNKPKSIIYLMYRWVFAVFFVCVLVYSMLSSVQDWTIGYWFIYLTNIGLLICSIYSVCAAIFVSVYHFDVIKLEASSFSYKIFWYLSNVTIVLAFLISIVYWATLFDWSTGAISYVDKIYNKFNFFLFSFFSPNRYRFASTWP